MPDPVASAGLTHGERLLVRTLRVLAVRGACDELRAVFVAACGAAGPEAYRALQVFVQHLAVCGRRRLRLSPPPFPVLTPDEAALIDVFACAQAEDWATLDARLEALTGVAPPSPPSPLGAAAAWVAQVFGTSGLLLRERLKPAENALLHAAE